MSTTTVNPALCDFCHQKPKFGGYRFCGKTCAAQANNLCTQCHQKPKFANYDYCGKSCAALAAQAQKRPLGAGTMNVPHHGQPTPGAAKGSNYGRRQQHCSGSIHPSATSRSSISAPACPIWPSASGASRPRHAHSAPRPANAYGTAPSPPSEPATCLIPDCDQPAHVDANGIQTSDYCSRRDASSEAVDKNLAQPCIMCLEMPQSRVDHFCGRACREEALSKPE
ncbi:hypothetical protein A0H81_13797 [Grifola frondosa]|uniref:Uncharacterized protein n=1 Tax=Grifola frondosa TaxID=5627 RepID=A0A1C7LPP6_GRIFR|nr:hypothetical protein A0H81_13797 [Grifola frondosa]